MTVSYKIPTQAEVAYDLDLMEEFAEQSDYLLMGRHFSTLIAELRATRPLLVAFIAAFEDADMDADTGAFFRLSIAHFIKISRLLTEYEANR